MTPVPLFVSDFSHLQPCLFALLLSSTRLLSATSKQQAIVIIYCIIYPASLCILIVTRYPLDIHLSLSSLY